MSEYKLNDPVTKLKYISGSYAKNLAKLDVHTLKDLLTYFPRTYKDSSEVTKINDLYALPDPEQDYTVRAEIEDFKSVRLRGKLTLQTAKISDESGSIEAKFFNQPYLKNTLKVGVECYLYGKIKTKGKNIFLQPSQYDVIRDNKQTVHLGRITPIYPLTEGITAKWLRNRIKDLVEKLGSEVKFKQDLSSFINPYSIEKLIENVHFPDELENLDASRDILSMLELVDIHLRIKGQKKTVFKSPSLDFEKIDKYINELIHKLPFTLTSDQRNALNKYLELIKKDEPVNSLLQGDVGSGKTVIAVALSYAFAKQGLQAVILTPTTVLSKQHKQTFDQMLSFDKGIEIELVTSDNKFTKKADILIGTTALLARREDLIDNVGILIVDEQHRFGVTQREEIVSNKVNSEVLPHFINMTATPIPRTIAEVFFSDVEVVSIKNKPIGRKAIKTHLFGMEKREDAINWVKEVVKNGDQVYWVCPLIEDGEVKPALSVNALGKELSSKMKGIKTKILHGKLKSEEKNKIMQAFADGKIDILISTTVIEVGIDVANATVMVIENPEMFGLAQLHQLRGRVGRGEKQSYCFLSLNTEISEEAKNRLEYFTSTNDGLAIAEFDLSRRGPGEVYGTKQSGIPKLKIATLKNLEMIKKSRSLAEKAYNSGIKSINIFR